MALTPFFVVSINTFLYFVKETKKDLQDVTREPSPAMQSLLSE